MEKLAARRKQFIFDLGVSWAFQVLDEQEDLHKLVGVALGEDFEWFEDPGLIATRGTVGFSEDPRRLQVTTAPGDIDPEIVSFVYVHEVAHPVLEHEADGALLFGQYTRREMEADAFAFACLYTLARHGIPCGGRIHYARIARALRTVHQEDRGFVWGDDARLQDISDVRATIRRYEQQYGIEILD